jgi:transcriptional regulator with XRE-family HTH domain
MEREGLSLEATGARLGVAHTTVMRWMNGSLRPSPARLRQIEALTGGDVPPEAARPDLAALFDDTKPAAASAALVARLEARLGQIEAALRLLAEAVAGVRQELPMRGRATRGEQPADVIEKVSELLRRIDARQAVLGLSDRATALQAGLGADFVRDMRRHFHPPKANKLVAIAAVLRVDPAYLLEAMQLQSGDAGDGS